MWLRDFLSRDMPCCRTMTYGYNSKLSSRGIGMMMDYGRGLMEELKKIRNTEEVGARNVLLPEARKLTTALPRQLRKRPLFFVAHSFGGIILAHVGYLHRNTIIVQSLLLLKHFRDSIMFLHLFNLSLN